MARHQTWNGKPHRCSEWPDPHPIKLQSKADRDAARPPRTAFVMMKTGASGWCVTCDEAVTFCRFGRYHHGRRVEVPASRRTRYWTMEWRPWRPAKIGA